MFFFSSIFILHNIKEKLKNEKIKEIEKFKTNIDDQKNKTINELDKKFNKKVDNIKKEYDINYEKSINEMKNNIGNINNDLYMVDNKKINELLYQYEQELIEENEQKKLNYINELESEQKIDIENYKKTLIKNTKSGANFVAKRQAFLKTKNTIIWQRK